MWPSANYDCPKFSNIRSLAIDNTSLFISNPSQLQLFLTSKLRELHMSTEPGQGKHPTQGATDRAWMSRLAAACVHLNVLALDVALGVSPADMMSLLCTTQLNTLCVSPRSNALLNRDILKKIFTLPELQHLSLACPLDSPFFDELLAERALSEVLPQARKLQLTCSTSEDPAAIMLLSSLKTLQGIVISFEPTTADQTVMPHPTLLDAISKLPELQTLTLCLSSRTHLTPSGVSAISSNEKIKSFTVTTPTDGFNPMPAFVVVSVEDFVRIPITFKLLLALDGVEVQAPAEMTYDEAVVIAHLVGSVSPGHLELFSLNVNEADSFGWPSEVDYHHVQEHDVWKGSTRSLAPDPIGWEFRDLHTILDGNGEVLTEEQVVTGGSYNQLTST